VRTLAVSLLLIFSLCITPLAAQSSVETFQWWNAYEWAQENH
jgi:hypothetical protein